MTQFGAVIYMFLALLALAALMGSTASFVYWQSA